MIPRAPLPEDDVAFLTRLRLLIRGSALALILVIGRVVYLNVILGPELREFSEQNFHTSESIDAPRGVVYDVRGRPLATNRMVFNVVARPHRLDRATLARSLEELGELTERDLMGRLDELAALRRARRTVTLLSGLQFDEAAPILERAPQLPGVSVERVYRRYYPDGPLAAHIIGHMGAISPEDLDERLERGYDPRDRVGRAHLENTLEDVLRGHKGAELVRRDARGWVREVVDRESARPGGDIALTLDRDLQMAAVGLLANRPGVVIAMDPRDGAIRAMVSYPTFDPNRPAEDFAPDRPAVYVNRVTQGLYMPGSAFKLVVAYAALQAGVRPDRRIHCEGKFYLPEWRQPYRCAARWGHGWVDMRQALQVSCNVYFYTLANELGPHRLIQAAQQWGFGLPTGVDYTTAEKRGELPAPGSLYPGDVLHIAIGQGRMTVTPLQVLRAYAALANGGRLVSPHLVAAVDGRPCHGVDNVADPAAARVIPLNPEWRRTLVDGFWAAVNEPGGTAHRARFDPAWNAAGKTSSAEREGEEKTTAWFVGFAPRQRPVIAVLAMVENVGHGGDITAPICRDLLAEYFRLYPL